MTIAVYYKNYKRRKSFVCDVKIKFKVLRDNLRDHKIYVLRV